MFLTSGHSNLLSFLQNTICSAMYIMTTVILQSLLQNTADLGLCDLVFYVTDMIGLIRPMTGWCMTLTNLFISSLISTCQCSRCRRQIDYTAVKSSAFV